MSLYIRFKKFRSSFQFKLFSLFTLMTALITLVVASIFTFSTIHDMRYNAVERLDLRARYLADSIRLPLYAENRAVLQQLADQTARAPQIHSVTITSASGKVLAETVSPGDPIDGDYIRSDADVVSSPITPSPDAALSGSSDTSTMQIGSVRLVRRTTDLSDKIQRFVIFSCVIGFLFWLLVSSFCHIVLKSVTSSYSRLIEGIEILKGGDYSCRIVVDTADEPGMASLAVNNLAEHLLLREEENAQLTTELVAAMNVERESRLELAGMNRALEAEVTERIKAEQGIRQSEQTLRNLMDLMPVGVILADLDNHVEYLNLFLVEHFGYGRELIRNVDEWFLLACPDPLYREDLLQRHNDVIARANAGEDEGLMYDARVRSSDGSVRHLIVNVQLAAKRRIMVLVDVTERELLQEQIVKAQKLESLGILAGGIAHNFNNILTGVLGYISFASKFLDSSHRSYELLQQAENASRRAAGMAKQLLTFARGGAPIKMLTSIREVLEESVELAVKGSNVECRVKVAPGIHSLMADEGQLGQVFNNIAINAVQAMPSGGVLTVMAENVLQPYPGKADSERQHFIRIVFQDEGHGIAEENLGKIFDPYFTTKSSGTGLGLASAYSIINRHDGRISVESNPGHGTIFTILLPSSGVPVDLPEENEEALELAVGNASKSILLMDDEEMIRALARESLEYLGYSVSACVNGEDAVAMYRNAYQSGTPFSLAILDLTIPNGMGGVEAARLILEIDPQAKLVVSSGYSYNAAMSDYGSHGFSAAVTKPYKIDELGRQLSLILADAE